MRIAQPFDRGSNTIIVIVTAVGCVEDSDASILICGASDRSHYRKCGGESCGRCNREIMFRKVSIERHGCLLSGHLDVGKSAALLVEVLRLEVGDQKTLSCLGYSGVENDGGLASRSRGSAPRRKHLICSTPPCGFI